MERSRTSAVGGWTLVWISLAITLGALALTAFVLGTGEEAIRSGLRTTARLGAVVFSVVFAASALNTLFRAAWSKWLLRNRRHLGVGFGVIHLGHGALIVLLAMLHPASFWASTDAVGLIGGSVGYVFTALMMATSSTAAVRLLGHRPWQTLHKTGMYVLWGIFVFSYAPRVVPAPAYAPLLALLLGALALRIVASARRRRFVLRA